MSGRRKPVRKDVHWSAGCRGQRRSCAPRDCCRQHLQLACWRKRRDRFRRPAKARRRAKRAAMPGAAGAATPVRPAKEAKPPRSSDRRRAAELYLSASKLFLNSQFEEALKEYERAAALDPPTPTTGWQPMWRAAMRSPR